MTKNFLNSISLTLTGSRYAVDMAASGLAGFASTAMQEYETVAADGRIVLVYRILLDRPYAFATATYQWLGWTRQLAKNIDGLDIRIDSCNEDLEWNRNAVIADCVQILSSYPLPLYPRAFSLYADVCSDIGGLVGRMQDVFTALNDLTHEVSLLDDYADLFPEYADIETLESLEECDDWERDEERAQDEADYGGWWETWKQGDESNIEKLHSGKVLIGLIGKLCDAGHADFVLPTEHRRLLDWIPDFVSLVDKHKLWHEEDDIQSIRLAVAWCQEMKMRSAI